MLSHRSFFSLTGIGLLLSFCACQTEPPTWESIGPFSETGVAPDVLPCAGRIDAIAFSPNFDGKATSAIYIAGPGSGVWRSSDFQTSDPHWVPLTDHITQVFYDATADRDFHQDITNILTLAVDPTFPRRIYAGTNSSASVILRSENGGGNWSVISEAAFNNHRGATKLFVDPGGTLYMAGAGGLWQQTSPGAGTFTNLAVAGVNPPGGDVEFHDAVYVSNGAGQPITVYVAIVDRKSPTRDKSGIWSWFNGSWNQMSINMLNLQGLPFFKADINRIKMYASPTSGVVAAMTSDNGKLRNLQGSFLNVFHLEKIRKPNGILTGWEPQWNSSTVFFNTQGGWNDMGTCIDHTGTIYSGGVGFGQSDGNGGVVNCQPRIQDGKHNIHVDEHVVLEYQNKIYVGTDGGLVRFTPNDNPQAGVHDYEPLNTNSLRNFLSSSVARNNNGGDFLIGNQDNGIAFQPFVGGTSSFTRISNENEWIRFVPYNVGASNQAIAYSWGPQRGFYKSTNGGHSFTEPGLPVTVNNGLYCFHQTEQGRMLLNVTLTKTINNLPVQVNSVYETRNNWLDQPKDILGNTLLTAGSPTALCYAGSNILVGAAGNVFISSDDGANWKQVWTNDARIVAIRSDPSNPNEIYLATDFIRRPGAVWHVTLGNDPTAAWTNVTNLTGNLVGEVTQLDLLTCGPGKSPYLYVAENDAPPVRGIGAPGVYETTSLAGNNTQWGIFGKGLPDVLITDLQIIPVGPGTGHMLVSTWGRGAWQVSILSH